MREAILKTVTGTIHRLKNLSSSKQSESDATDGAKLAAQKQKQDVGHVIHVSDENVGNFVIVGIIGHFTCQHDHATMHNIKQSYGHNINTTVTLYQHDSDTASTRQ